ncbi:MAG: ComEC/Rec2 family competence protein [Nitriliruptoraceae bacterium]
MTSSSWRGPAASVVGPPAVVAIVAVTSAWLTNRLAVELLHVSGYRQLLQHQAAATFWLSSAVALTGIAAVTAWRVVATGRPQFPTIGSGASASATLRRGLAAVLLVAVVVVVGTAARVAISQSGALMQLADHGGNARVEAVVVREPQPVAHGWHVVLRVVAIDGHTTRERAATTLPHAVPLGTTWQATVTARPLPDSGYGRWIGQQHVGVLLDGDEWHPVGSPGPLARASEHVRASIRQVAQRALKHRSAGLVVGLVTGDTRMLNERDIEAMQQVGLSHLTAVSGSHVAVVIAGVIGLSTLLRLPLPWQRGAIGVTIVWFAFVTRLQPSVLRAGCMALILLMVAARGRPRDARHALAVAVLVLILVDPLLASSLGLLLSATATAGVLVIAPMVAERLPRLPPRLAQVVSVTVGAQIAVLPLLLTTFGTVSLASIPANVVAVPAAMMSAGFAFTGAVIASFWQLPAIPLFWLAGVGAEVVLWSATTFARVGVTVDVTRPVTVIALAAACCWMIVRLPVVRRTLVAITAAACVAASVPWISGMLPVRDFYLTNVDVGQGDMFLIESPGARILVDAGRDGTAARWLRANGRRRLDLVVVTHPHLDHVGGIADVVRLVRVGQLWYRPLPTDLDHVDDMLAAANERGVDVVNPIAGMSAIVGDVLVEVLHPPPGRPFQSVASELNDTSTVIRVTAADGRRILATGDVERTGQRRLLDHAADQLQAELFTVPHHGGNTSDFAFLAAVCAQAAAIGVGDGNHHGHPHPDVLAMLAELDLHIYRTDTDGTTRIRVPDRVSVPGFSSSMCR